MRILEIEVTRVYTIEIDDNSEIVQEYANDEELVNDLVGYRFEVLPVIGQGVTIKDDGIPEWEIQ